MIADTQNQDATIVATTNSNGLDPVNFALANDAEKTAKYMAKRSNINYVALLAKL